MVLDLVQYWWLDRLMEGELIHPQERWRQTPVSAPWPTKVCSKTLYDAMREFVTTEGGIIPSDTKFALELNSMTMTRLRRKTSRWTDPNEVSRSPDPRVMSNAIVNLPTLVECRRAFEALTNQHYNWKTIVDDSFVTPVVGKQIPTEWLK